MDARTQDTMAEGEKKFSVKSTTLQHHHYLGIIFPL